ncbi:MAG: TIGR02266 family protein [Deltaproteobacteria bacterium]|nr:TIGR02266 family protein [Deltaproteobacteria bacterium]
MSDQNNPLDPDFSVNALDLLRTYKKLNERKNLGLSEQEQNLLNEIEKKLAQLVNPKEKKTVSNQRSNLRVGTNLAIKLATASDLKNAFMKNISGGGLYIETTEVFKMGQKLEVELTLPNDNQSFKVKTEIAWLNPSGMAGLPPGVGVKFLDLDQKIKNKIQSIIDSAIEKKIKPTEVKKK